ncbi:MAG: phosphoribosyltransferase [Sulfurovum sp. FS06-10]|jgi:predicted phosphoribosyltransferase|nr:MAG: phosphoribosyltransferase [Sulfurovum sp. FS06-10]
MFKNRELAGVLLASKLLSYSNFNDVIVVALPRGGVPVGFEVAKKLHVPLDIFFVKKIPSPYNKEVAVGSVTETGYYYVDNYAKRMLRISDVYIEKNVQDILEKMHEKRELYGTTSLSYNDKTIIIVDDGIATGASMLLAIEALKKEGAKKLIVATPIAPFEIVEKLKAQSDEVMVLEIPKNFQAVGQFYEDFHQLNDQEVIDILQALKF